MDSLIYIRVFRRAKMGDYQFLPRTFSTFQRKFLQVIFALVLTAFYCSSIPVPRSVFLTFRPDFTSNLVHGLTFKTPKFYIAHYYSGYNCDLKSDLKSDLTSHL